MDKEVISVWHPCCYITGQWALKLYISNLPHRIDVRIQWRKALVYQMPWRKLRKGEIKMWEINSAEVKLTNDKQRMKEVIYYPHVSHCYSLLSFLLEFYFLSCLGTSFWKMDRQLRSYYNLYQVVKLSVIKWWSNFESHPLVLFDLFQLSVWQTPSSASFSCRGTVYLLTGSMMKEKWDRNWFNKKVQTLGTDCFPGSFEVDGHPSRPK